LYTITLCHDAEPHETEKKILGQIRILGFVNLITDPAPDPDPALFVGGFEDANKKLFFFLRILLIIFFQNVIQHFFICRTSNSTVSEDAGI
jgi:hypothetical protein